MMTLNKAEKNYITDILSIIPFLLLLITGFILLPYHTGKAYSAETLHLSGYSWIEIHQVLTVISIILITIHLQQHIKWFKKWLNNAIKPKHKRTNQLLFVFFMLTSCTGVYSWLAMPEGEHVGIHSKLGIVLTIFFIIHAKHYFSWLYAMKKNTGSKEVGKQQPR